MSVVLRTCGAGVLLVLAGCRLGPQPGKFRPATQTTGISATATTPSQTVTGELLELRDSALVVLGAQLMLVPVRLIDSATFSDTRVRMYKGFPLTFPQREQLRLLSRYPYGMPEGVQAKLLTSRSQAAIVVIDR
ncbi:MAG TPA: hypothetical protein VE869_11580 [Gemmatimonas sp.]|nr:hypothetical protein [Gemmatimonas sp.]